MRPWGRTLPRQLAAALAPQRHGDLRHWRQLLAELPRPVPSSLALAAPTVRIGAPADCDAATRTALEAALRQLHPWRKGPFEVFGIHIDAEWRSDRKWARLEHAVSPLAGRLVLDVGAGNGYYALRMLGAGAARVIGIDPTLRYVFQFLALKRLAGDLAADILPLALEDLPPKLQAFDTVFSMGVLYHRRSPFDHLFALKDCLRRGGELVLETLVTEGREGEVLVPRDRYARMRNVWFIPSVVTLEGWLVRAGFERIRCIDVSRTTPEEQRATDWMRFQSLADFLDPSDPDRTVEGYPAPRRAILLAEKP
ncbi:tRNA 5-methoxyuridine(34)/uridine 5-oxyacetic acid(34) synthase CmoB [Methylomarinovum caldicuralii]|uniref:tRNA 5-methoxyuridine(34)/uridine 5-oxyacetic acid(34) synthase CmoB n=1 Tax=Methylomarinovum caldicuralii TaxID=438856 RepID=UPI0029533EA5|nr:tRNA 5-methoxyuridine(34)/uridine 5-oxyacetic acid(34) synthase CmoB [Methylomarinovum caldicuralii]